jgi:methylglutaconyl-CoA hydratase
MASLKDPGSVTAERNGAVVEVRFSHPKGNSLPKELLGKLASTITAESADASTRVLLLSSIGEGPFCGGASFDELVALTSLSDAEDFFMGFGRVILALVRAPCITVARVQGKAVGGGVGLIAACDYSVATSRAAVRLSELAIGLGPHVIGPAVARRISAARFSDLAVSAVWQDAAWCKAAGLYSELVGDSVVDLDAALQTLIERLSKTSKESVVALKKTLWGDASDWERVLPEQARKSGALAMTEFCRAEVAKLREKGL